MIVGFTNRPPASSSSDPSSGSAEERSRCMPPNRGESPEAVGWCSAEVQTSSQPGDVVLLPAMPAGLVRLGFPCRLTSVKGSADLRPRGSAGPGTCGSDATRETVSWATEHIKVSALMLGPIVAPVSGSIAKPTLFRWDSGELGELGGFSRVPDMNSDNSGGRKHSTDSPTPRAPTRRTCLKARQER